MKQISIGTLTILLLIVTSCKKENSIASPQNNSKQAETMPSLQSQGWGIHRVYVAALGRCVPPAVNCYDDIVITAPKVMKAFSGLKIAISTSKAAVTSFFNSTQAIELSAYFTADDFNKLKDGSYSVILQTNDSTGFDYYLVGDYEMLSPENVIHAYPIDIQ